MWTSNSSGRSVNGAWHAYTGNPVVFTTTLGATPGDTDVITLTTNDTNGNVASKSIYVLLTATEGGSWESSPTQTPTETESGGLTVMNLNLGNAAANSIVHVKLVFSCSETALTVESVTLSAPFNAWCVSIALPSSAVNLLNGVGSVELTFRIPGNAAGPYNGTATVQAQDNLGVTYTGSGDVSTIVGSSSTVSEAWNWVQAHLMICLAAGIVLLALVAAVGVAVHKRKRHH
jgi:hypothetical protein